MDSDAALAWFQGAVEDSFARCRMADSPSCVPEELTWQRPPRVHAMEFVVVNALAVAAGLLGSYLLKREPPQEKTRGPRFPVLAEQVLGVTFFALFFLQAVFKCMRRDGYIAVQIPFTEAIFEFHRGLVWLSMPCHIYTLMVGTLLAFGTMLPHGVTGPLASMLVTSAWNTFLGSAFADFSDQEHWSEPWAFVFHHGLLNIIPFYIAVSYRIHKFTLGWLLWSSCWITLWNMAVQNPLCYLSGFNINYHTHPPTRGLPSRVFGADPYYKPKIILILVLLSTSSHLLVGAAGRAIRSLLEPVHRKSA